MIIRAENLSKKYYSNWVIKDFSYEFNPRTIVGIRGRNGSGKSTLLQLLSSILTPTSGTVSYIEENAEIPAEQARYSISLTSPAIRLPQTMTVEETIDFHFRFQRYLAPFTKNRLLENIWLQNERKRSIKELSSGMKQRLKLGLAFFSESDFLLLDEPTSNLDEKGIDWVNRFIEKKPNHRGIIIASNESRDFIHCSELLSVMDYK